MSNATTAILAALNSPTYEVVRKNLRKSMVEDAHRLLKFYQERVAEWESEGNYRADRKTFPGCPFNLNWVNCGKLEYLNIDSCYVARKGLVAGMTVIEAEVIKSADARWEDAKAFYAARVGEKIEALLPGSTVVVDVSKDQELVGHCRATAGDKELVLETSMKTNYRYGENSANGDLTIYRQVPTVIASAKGFDAVARQAELDAAAVKAKGDKKAKIAELSKQIDTIERRKRVVDDLHHTIKFVADYSGGIAQNGNLDDINKRTAELGLTKVPSLQEAKLLVKSIRESLKAAKAELKAVKAVK